MSIRHTLALLAASGLALGCASAARPPVTPRPAPSPRATRALPPAPPSYAARVESERARIGDRLAAERAAEDPSEEPLHLVLEAGLCYRVSALVEEATIEVALEDEHGLAIGRASGEGEARLGGEEGVCPRWTGSFALRVSLPDAHWSRSHTVFVERLGAGRSATGD